MALMERKHAERHLETFKQEHHDSLAQQVSQQIPVHILVEIPHPTPFFAMYNALSGGVLTELQDDFAMCDYSHTPPV